MRVLNRAGLIGILSSFLLASCSPGGKPPVMKIPKDAASFALSRNGGRRTGALHVPAAYDGSRPYSLVIGLHGANQSGEAFRGMGFDAIADGLDWIVAYPDGAQGRWEGPDEVPFIADLIEAAEARFNIDPGRVYATGHSAGAIFAYELASALPGRLAAIAPVAGLARAGLEAGAPAPVSIIHVHALDDVSVPYGGDEEYGFLSAEESLALWRRIDGASDGGKIFASGAGIDGTLWRGRLGDVALLRYGSGGHVWLPMASDYIADFFYNHPSRKNRVRIQRAGLPPMIAEYSPATLRVDVEDPASVGKVEFFSNGALIGESAARPFAFGWDRPPRGRHVLSAVATLKGGERIASTLNPSVLAARPLRTADGKPASMPATLQAVSASSSSIEEPQYEAKYAIDGSILTRWSSAFKDGQSLTLDLGYERNVCGVSLFWEKAYASEYDIETSIDGKAWDIAASRSEGSGGEEYIDFPTRRVKFVRMVGKLRHTEWGFSLWEMIIHGE
jgi:polyhydroxybutyrate depolymerase